MRGLVQGGWVGYSSAQYAVPTVTGHHQKRIITLLYIAYLLLAFICPLKG